MTGTSSCIGRIIIRHCGRRARMENLSRTRSCRTTGTSSAFLILQDDGNLSMYLQDGAPLWASKTMLTPAARLNLNQQLTVNGELIADNKRTRLVLQSDGNLV